VITGERILEGRLQLFGVCDGHGEYGHYVSGMIKKELRSISNNNIWRYTGWVNKGWWWWWD